MHLAGESATVHTGLTSAAVAVPAGSVPPLMLLADYYLTIQAVILPIVGRSGTELPPSVVLGTPVAAAAVLHLVPCCFIATGGDQGV